MHVDPEVEDAKVATGVILQVDVGIYAISMGHDIGHVALLIRDQGVEGNVFVCFLCCEEQAAGIFRACFQGEAGGRPDGNEVGFERDVRFFVITAAAFTGYCETDHGYQGSAYEELPHQFPKFYGTQF